MAIRIPVEDVQSSTIGALGYDTSRSILAIRFKSKQQIRHYAGVPYGVAQEFYCASSKGQFFNQQIRGKYQVEQMTGDCPKCGDHGWVGDTCADCGCAPYAAPVLPPLHYVFADEPTAGNKRGQRAACGAIVQAREVGRVMVTCEACKAARAAYDGAVIE